MRDLNAELKMFQIIDSEFAKALYDSFPGFILNGQGQSGADFHAYMHEENKFFENTEYCYKQPLEFFI
jgi:hypothetical protein